MGAMRHSVVGVTLFVGQQEMEMRQTVVIVLAGLLVAGCGKALVKLSTNPRVAEDANEPPEIYHYTLPNGVGIYTAEPLDAEKVIKRLRGQHD